MGETRIDWLVRCDPRPVQLEAIRRSYYGLIGHNHREEPVNEVRFRDGPAAKWAHYMEMRLGKTPTLLNESELFLRDYGIDLMVVLSPNPYVGDWVVETEKFGVTRPVFRMDLSKAQKLLAEMKKVKTGGLVLIANYEITAYDHGREFLSQFVNKKTYFAVDESIKAKNHTSWASKTVMGLARDAGVVRLASGLPMTQGPQDMYPQFRALGRMNGVSFFSYRNRFCKMGGFKAKKVVGVKNEEQFQEELATCSFVAKRKDWGKITTPEFYTVDIPMAPVQAKHYHEMDEDFITILGTGEEISVMQVISKMLKLQQISSGFMYDENKKFVPLMPPKDVPKYKRLRELLEDEIPGKVVVPYHYGATGDMLLELLADFNPAVIRGSDWMKKNERDVILEKKRFNNDKNCRVMLGNIQAMKYGHYLAGTPEDRCCHMVFYENTYSLDDRTQVEMRNTSDVQDWSNVYLDFASSAVERASVKALSGKMDLVETVFGVYNPNRARSTRT